MHFEKHFQMQLLHQTVKYFQIAKVRGTVPIKAFSFLES
jgi:hypothetical protein